MNTTYASKINPQFSNAGVQDVTPDLSPVKAGLDIMIKENQNELNALKNIAEDQAQIEFNRGAAELVDKYGTDFKGLDKALLKLENDLYGRIKPTQPVMAENLLRQFDATRLRAVDHAHNTYNKNINTTVKKTSGTMLDGTEANAEGDFLIYLGEVSTKQPDERKPENIMPFLKDLEQHNAILARKDMDGNPIFTDTQIASRKGMKGVRMNAAYRYIDGMTLDQLKNFYNTTFQSEQWDKDTGFNVDDKHKLESRITSRIKNLEKDEKHEMKVLAAQKTADLINNSGDMVTINELKKGGIIPEKLIDKTVQASNKLIEENWYDPNNSSDPMGLLKLYSKLDRITSQTTGEPDNTFEKLETFTDIVDEISNNRKELNLQPEKYREYMDDMKRAIVDKEFANDLRTVDVSGYARKLLEENEKYAVVSPEWSEKQRDIISSYEKAGKLTPEEEKFQKSIVRSDFFGKRRAQREAVLYADQQLPVIMSYIKTGMIDAAKAEFEKTKYNVRKLQNSYWLPPEEMDRLQAELEAGKKPLYYHNGAVLEYNGASGDTSLFKIKL